MKTFICLIAVLICATDLVLSSTFFIPPTKRLDENGTVTNVCELMYGNEVFNITDKAVFLPIEQKPKTEEDCFRCSNCTETGTGCEQLFRRCPSEQELKEDEELLHPAPLPVTPEEGGNAGAEVTEGGEKEVEMTEDPDHNGPGDVSIIPDKESSKETNSPVETKSTVQTESTVETKSPMETKFSVETESPEKSATVA